MNALFIAPEVLELANVAVWITRFTEQGVILKSEYTA